MVFSSRVNLLMRLVVAGLSAPDSMELPKSLSVSPLPPAGPNSNPEPQQPLARSIVSVMMLFERILVLNLECHYVILILIRFVGGKKVCSAGAVLRDDGSRRAREAEAPLFILLDGRSFGRRYTDYLVANPYSWSEARALCLIDCRGYRS